MPKTQHTWGGSKRHHQFYMEALTTEQFLDRLGQTSNRVPRQVLWYEPLPTFFIFARIEELKTAVKTDLIILILSVLHMMT
jgi:hypothetical protein